MFCQDNIVSSLVLLFGSVPVCIGKEWVSHIMEQLTLHKTCQQFFYTDNFHRWQLTNNFLFISQIIN